MIRQQHDAVGVEPLRFQRIDAPQDLVIVQVDHRDGPVAHAFQIEQAVLDEEVPFIGRQHAMMGAGSGWDSLEKLRLPWIAVVIQIDKPRLGGGHKQAVPLRVVEHFQRHPLLPWSEIIDLSERKCLGRRIPDPGPQRPFQHIGDVHHGGISIGAEHNFDGSGFGGRRFRRDFVRREHVPGTGFQHRDRLTRFGHIRLDGARHEHTIDAVVNRNPVRIQNRRHGRLSRADRFDRLILDGVTHDHVARAHTGEVPRLVIFRHDEILADLAVRYGNRAQPVGEPGEVHDVQKALAQGRDIGFALVAVEKDVVRDEVGGKRNLH